LLPGKPTSYFSFFIATSSSALRIAAPARNATINGSSVEVKLELSGDLKGYMPHKDPATGKAIGAVTIGIAVDQLK